ncbi:hypothetical protein CPB83DRAFT_844580 [Crepidotus variabilis]|uniref:Nephrocystin 3-like N-terminal domain-containing protein n=1 Tax=Crepidotus variabilis TaxID=179855 RepID=A0A9P6ERC2_9AGAR|nr:hypothetical protein CPB83DRAFT_844580 [Crepidotus variabilis]
MSGQQASFFHNAHNVSVTESTFNAIINSTTHNHESQASGIYGLSQKISTSAMHDSSARDPPPRCHPDTRKLALNKIVAFVDDPKPEEVVMWMNAPFGHGKSAVMQTVIETLRASGRAHRVAGAFFFGRDKEGRNKAHYLLPTILYQIANNIPGMYEHIDSALRADPTLPSKSIEAQLIPLLVVPFQQCSPCSSQTPTIFIDGLDECHTNAAQRSVLKMIADAITVHHVPLRFVVASRPEAHLEEYFKKEPLRSATRVFTLDHDFNSMRKYLQAGFDEIYHARDDVMFGVPAPWPSDSTLNNLVWRASGQYLFASTILRFVGDEYSNPLEQLQVILAPHPRRSSAFSDIDVLYTQILLVCPTHLRDCLLRVLAAIIVLDDTTIAALSDLLDENPSNIITVLRGLRAVVKINELPLSCIDFHKVISPSLSVYHVSLKEYLTDKSRAGDLWIDEDAMEKELIQRADFLLAMSLSDIPVTMHHQTWASLRSLAPPATQPASGDCWPGWPLFVQQYSKLEKRLTGVLSPQQIAASCFLLRFGPDKGSDVRADEFYLSRMATALQKHLHSSPNRLGLFDILQNFTLLWTDSDVFYFESSLSMLAQQLHLTSSSLADAMETVHIFLEFELTDSDVLVYLHRSLVDILNRPKLVGWDAHMAYREAVLLSISASYNKPIIFNNFELFQAQVSWLNNSLLGDDSAAASTSALTSSPAMLTLLTRMRSPLFQEVIISHLLQLFEDPLVCIQLLTFIVKNCVKAHTLGPSLQNLVRILSEIAVSLIRNGFLTAVFQDAYYYNCMAQQETYKDLFGKENPIRDKCLSAMSRKDHTTIVEYALFDVDTFLHEILRIDIMWREHFTKANYSDIITKGLIKLYTELPVRGNFAGFVPDSFILGIMAWKQMYIEVGSEDDKDLNELCILLQLWCMPKLTIEPAPDARLSTIDEVME